MNKINPLHIVAFLIVVILILIFKVNFIQKNINTLSYSIEKTKQSGIYLSEIKKEFGNKQKQVKFLKKFLKSNGLDKSPHKLRISSSEINIDIVNVESKLANKVVSKILNTSLLVSSFEIKDVDFNKTIKIKIKF